MIIATFDIGTTAVKGVLVTEKGDILASASEHVTTFLEGGKKEQEPEEWFQAFCRISRSFVDILNGAAVDGIIMSGQMQDVIPVTEDGHPAGRAILYSDGRAVEESEELTGSLGREYLEKVTGNHYDGSLSLPKVMWLKKYCPEVYERTSRVLISAKDYIILKLTGAAVGDVVACSTAGAMNIADQKWDEAVLKAAGVPMKMMPKLCYPHEVAGTVHENGARAAGYPVGTKVYVGIGDAGATTLASGISGPGQYNINLGTSGWVAAVSSETASAEGGMFNLAAFENGFYINVVPFLNAGNVHRWVSRLFSADEQAVDYERINDLLEHSQPGSDGVMFLPYLNGERFPVLDEQVKGCYLGITADTDQGDMVRSCLEGVAFSIRQGVERLGTVPQKISVIGGGGRVSVWNQILADVLGQTVYVYRNSEVLPALALGASVLLAEGVIQSYSEFTDSLQDEKMSVRYLPVREHQELYDQLYEKYLGIYPLVKPYFHK